MKSQKMDKRELINRITFLTGVLTYLVEDLDDLKNYPTIYQHEFKRNVNNLIKDIDTKLKFIFDGESIEVKQQGMYLSDTVYNALKKARKEYIEYVNKYDPSQITINFENNGS